MGTIRALSLIRLLLLVFSPSSKSILQQTPVDAHVPHVKSSLYSADSFIGIIIGGFYTHEVEGRGLQEWIRRYSAT